jgi:ferredoxin/flavodoxin
MSLIRSLLGRRQFLISFVISNVTLAFGSIARAFDLIFQTAAAMATDKPRTSERKSLKGIVVYYSATGNTAKIAGAIYRGMKSVIACDVAPIKNVKPEDMSKYDVMALGSPNWFHREVANTKVFTHDMPRMDGKHCILFATQGGQPIVQFWSMSRNILKKGMTIIGWNFWYGTSDMTLHVSRPDRMHGHPDKIDLLEAEAFGRQMAKNSVRIYAGERDLIPEIPTPLTGEGMWLPSVNEEGNVSSSHGAPNAVPEFDLTKCVYPRCTQCIDNCPLQAIDFSVITSVGSTDSPLVRKEACAHCGGVCQRVCRYDVISYEAEKTMHEIDMKKCTYPKCTLCVDECPQDAIDFSKNPPVFHNHCEGCDLCWCICPKDAIDIPNMAAIHLKKAWYLRGSGMESVTQVQTTKEGKGQPIAEAFSNRTNTLAPDFRQLIPDEKIGVRGKLMYDTNFPRVVLNKKDWPYEVDEG